MVAVQIPAWKVELAMMQAGDALYSWIMGMPKQTGKRGGSSVIIILILGLAFLGFKQGFVEKIVAALPADKGTFVPGADVPFAGTGYEAPQSSGVAPPAPPGGDQGGSLSPSPARAVAAGSGPQDFLQAKDLMRQVYADHRVDEYCGCRFDSGMNVDGACGVSTPTHADRARRIEWEHIVPASDFGRQRACWINSPEGVSGRKNCRDTDPEFRLIEADPYNLIPAIGSLNAIRSNYRFGEVQGEAREFGSCNFEVSSGDGRFVEPPDRIKGDVARAYLYFETAHGFRIGRSQRALFEAWDRTDPLDEWEFKRALRIYKATGINNPIVVERARHFAPPAGE